MKKVTILLSVIIIGITSLSAQKKYQFQCVAFYNLENLFDTIVDPNPNLILQDDFTPQGPHHWNTDKYYKKLDNLAFVISQLGTELVPTGPAVIGVAEVENATVLNDLVNRPLLKNRHYKFVHYDSPDERGIDVALLYQPEHFIVKKSWIRRETGLPHGDRTRDALIVYGLLDGEPFYFMVDHWPSRRGGQKRSEPLRDTVAAHDYRVIDSILKTDPNAKIVFMGDLNDDPTDESVKIFMHSIGDINAFGRKLSHKKKKNKKLVVAKKGDLYNPMEEKFRAGIGTLAYNDVWNLFDQFMMTEAVVKGIPSNSYKFYLAKIFRKNFMFQQEGHFKGYPHRTFAGTQFLNGYSDHLPVYFFLRKEKK